LDADIHRLLCSERAAQPHGGLDRAEMIVWGGQGAVIFGDGARYDPAADSWAATVVQREHSLRSL
jgi:hypothetical protein